MQVSDNLEKELIKIDWLQKDKSNLQSFFDIFLLDKNISDKELKGFIMDSYINNLKRDREYKDDELFKKYKDMQLSKEDSFKEYKNNIERKVYNWDKIDLNMIKDQSFYLLKVPVSIWFKWFKKEIVFDVLFTWKFNEHFVNNIPSNFKNIPWYQWVILDISCEVNLWEKYENRIVKFNNNEINEWWGNNLFWFEIKQKIMLNNKIKRIIKMKYKWIIENILKEYNKIIDYSKDKDIYGDLKKNELSAEHYYKNYWQMAYKILLNGKYRNIYMSEEVIIW